MGFFNLILISIDDSYANNRLDTIIDATDGQIVVFCAPGSQIRHNTIISKTRGALGGINLVDSFPFDCDYRGTVVHDNIIRTEGKHQSPF